MGFPGNSPPFQHLSAAWVCSLPRPTMRPTTVQGKLGGEEGGPLASSPVQETLLSNKERLPAALLQGLLQPCLEHQKQLRLLAQLVKLVIQLLSPKFDLLNPLFCVGESVGGVMPGRSGPAVSPAAGTRHKWGASTCFALF